MKRVALLFVFIAGWAAPGAFAQDSEHVQVGVFADYFRSRKRIRICLALADARLSGRTSV